MCPFLSSVVISFQCKLSKYANILSEICSIFDESNSPYINGNLEIMFIFALIKAIYFNKLRSTSSNENMHNQLSQILKRARNIGDNEEMIMKISLLPDITENFLISLLKNDLCHVIPFIYESPYVLSKLADAGFETDPRTKDSTGKSAFFHALKTEESHLVFLLYDHAANAWLQTDASVRSPDPVIVYNLKCLTDFLRVLETELDSEEVSEKSRFLFKYLCRFNEFQIKMCNSIIKIRGKKYENHTEKVSEVLRRKDIILAILETYETYFVFINGKSSIDADNISRFVEFFEHKDYFDNLDFRSAMMFFDNLFLLKERLLLPNNANSVVESNNAYSVVESNNAYLVVKSKNAYSVVESDFFLFLFYGKYMRDILWKRYEKQKSFYFVSRWIAFQKRLSFKMQIHSFKEILKETEVAEDIIVDKEPDEVVRTLTNLPEMYGQFLVFRLQHYLNAATGIIVKDLKSILVIERSLQVIGESCKNSDFNSVQTILTLGLPSDFIKHLKQIRNRYSHIKSHELLYKYNLEQNVELFKGIQNELTKLTEFLLPIYSVHKYKMYTLCLERFAESVREARKITNLKEHENQLNAILPSPKTEEYQLVQTRWDDSFDDMQNTLETEINDLNCKGNILDKNTASAYKCIVQNMICAIRKELKSLKDSVSEIKKEELKSLDCLDSRFWCLEKILTYITTDQNMISAIKKELNSLKYSVSEIKKEELKSLDSKFLCLEQIFTRITTNQNIISAIRKELNSLKDSVSYIKREELKSLDSPFWCLEQILTYITTDRLDSQFWCLEQILTYITTDQRLTMHSTTLKTMSENRNSLFAELRKNSIQSQKTIKSPDTSTEGTLVAESKMVGTDLPSEPEDPHNNDQKAVNPIPTYEKYDVFTNASSSTFSNETVDNGASHKRPESFKTNQVAKEINRESVENCVLRNKGYDSISQETTVTKEYKEAAVVCENTEDPVTEENDSLFAEAISTTSRDGEAEGPAEMVDVKRKPSIKEVSKFLSDYEEIAGTLFQEFKKNSNEYFLFKNIDNYCWILKGHNILNEKEKEFILQRVPEKFQNVSEKLRLIVLIAQSTKFTKEIEKALADLNLDNQENKKIKKKIESGLILGAIASVCSTKDYFLDLKEKIESQEISEKEYELLCNKLEIKDKAKKIFLQIVKGKNKKNPCNRFEFLLDGITMLEKILIDEHKSIQELWDKPRTPRIKMHVKEKIVQMYLNDSAVQASVETLLFDCMAILDMIELKHLWRKATNLFKGINLRNVLAHGHPLLESLGRLLDPYDLPSELVEKILKLISDKHVIDCIQQILIQSKIDSMDFMEILEDEEVKDLSKQIQNCEHFHEYASLIKMRDDCHRKNDLSP